MNFLRKLFAITPFKLSFFITLVFVGSAIMHDINPYMMPMMSTIEQKGLDIKFVLRGPRAPKNKVIILAGDEKSFQTFGQWPWDRGAVFAPMFEKLCSLGVKAVGLDIVWNEFEKTVPDKLRTSLVSALPGKDATLDRIIADHSGDVALGKAMAKCPEKIVMGYALTQEESQGLPIEEFIKRFELIASKGGNTLNTITKGKVVFAEHAGDPNANLSFYQGAKTGLLNIPTIVAPGIGAGFFNNEPDGDGNYRHGLFTFHIEDIFVPSMPLRVAQKALSQNDAPLSLLVQPAIPERNQTEDLRLEIKTASGPRTLPMDLSGKALVNFRGPNLTFPNISLADFLSSNETIEYTQFDPVLGDTKQKKHITEIFKDALVIFGVTGVGLYDIRPRPFDPQASGVENHASILDNIMSNDFIIRPTAEMFIALNLALIVLSLVFGLVVIRLDAKLGAIFALGTVTVMLWADQKYLFNRNILFNGHLQAAQFLFQYLAITVLKYMKEETEKKFIRGAFGKYVSPSVVNEMLKDPHKLALGGEKKSISVMFSDIRGFTELSEKVDVKNLSHFLNEYLGAMTDILQANKGTLDKYIGDAVMGFWGAPLEVPDNAQMAVKSAVEMINKLAELNKSFKEKYNLTIDIGLGINTGEVSVGNFGSSKVFSYTIIGDNVNLASRLEGLNKFYGTHIIISEETKNAIKEEAFFTREIDLVKVKGKKKPVKIFEVVPDTPDHSAMKSALAVFNDAFSAYYTKNWDGAIAKFGEFLVKNAGDKVSTEMVHRCEHFKQNPPADDWDGSWTMTSK